MNPTPAPGSTFGAYQLEEQIGAGGMAVVYKARRLDTQTLAAVKILHTHFAAQPDFVARFRREADISRRLQHRNIVPIDEVGSVDESLYLAMPFMPKGNLAQQFQAPNFSISLKSIAWLLQEIAKGLQYAHDQRIIHRDLKLENILLNEQGRPALSDFGIARVIAGTRLTRTGETIGTPLYMSPEQISGNYDDLDHRSDLYSFGVMAYLMSTGYYPFTTHDSAALMYQHVHTPPPPARQVNPQLPAAVEQVLAKGLAKDPAKRYQSAQNFAQEYANAIAAAPDSKTRIKPKAQNPIEPETVRGNSLSESTPPVTEDMLVDLLAKAAAKLNKDTTGQPQTSTIIEGDNNRVASRDYIEVTQYDEHPRIKQLKYEVAEQENQLPALKQQLASLRRRDRDWHERQKDVQRQRRMFSLVVPIIIIVFVAFVIFQDSTLRLGAGVGGIVVYLLFLRPILFPNRKISPEAEKVDALAAEVDQLESSIASNKAEIQQLYNNPTKPKRG